MAKKKTLSTVSLSSYRMADSSHAEVDVVCRILIVCEGEKTEPNYFKSFNRINRGGVVYDLTCEGGRINTLQVVEKAIEMRNAALKTTTPFDSVWAVFDKDSFPDADFNAAIQKAQSNGINCAWSNEAFELWYVYHFVNRITAMSRSDYQRHITSHIKKHKKGYVYKKNDINMHHFLAEYGSEEQAIKFAELQANTFEDLRYAQHNPSTMVYKLVKLLRGEDETFNSFIRREIIGEE